MAASMKPGSSVNIPASKLRLAADFIPMPAPVRLAEPIYTSSLSMTTIFICTRGHRRRSILLHSAGYLSKSSRKACPGSLAWIRRTSTPFLTRSLRIYRRGTTVFSDFFTYKSFRSAVAIHSNRLTFGIREITSL